METSLKRQEDIILKARKEKSGMKKLARKDRKMWDETGFIDAFRLWFPRSYKRKCNFLKS